LVTSCCDIVVFLKLSETDLAIRLILLAIGVELEYRSVARSLSGWGPKGESDAPIAIESEIVDFFRLLKLICRPDSSIIAIGVETEYRYAAISLSGWDPKGELNAPIAAESEIADSLKLLMMIQRSNSSMLTIGVETEYRSIARSLSEWGTKGELKARSPLGARLHIF
jgi:hypothetical protein